MVIDFGEKHDNLLQMPSNIFPRWIVFELTSVWGRVWMAAPANKRRPSWD
jgi:hypothetical protein